MILALALFLPAACLGGCAGKKEPEAPAPEQETVEGLPVVSAEEVNTFRGDSLRHFGRTYTSSGALALDNAATGFEAVFYGTKLEAYIQPMHNPLIIRVYIDGGEGESVSLMRSRTYALAEGLTEGVHTVRVVKATTSQHGVIYFSELQTDGKFLVPPKKDRPSIEFLGDSISVGGGILATASESGSIENSDATLAFPYIAAGILDADYSLVATDGICTKAKTALPDVNMIEMYGYLSSVTFGKYEHPLDQFDVVVIGVGTNDAYALSSGYTIEEYQKDYPELLQLVREKNPDAKIVCVYGMMIRSEPIEQVILDSVAAMHDPRVTALQLPISTGGAAAHPDVAGGKQQGEALAEYLKTIL